MACVQWLVEDCNACPTFRFTVGMTRADIAQEIKGYSMVHTWDSDSRLFVTLARRIEKFHMIS